MLRGQELVPVEKKSENRFVSIRRLAFKWREWQMLSTGLLKKSMVLKEAGPQLFISNRLTCPYVLQIKHYSSLEKGVNVLLIWLHKHLDISSLRSSRQRCWFSRFGGGKKLLISVLGKHDSHRLLLEWFGAGRWSNWASWSTCWDASDTGSQQCNIKHPEPHWSSVSCSAEKYGLK